MSIHPIGRFIQPRREDLARIKCVRRQDAPQAWMRIPVEQFCDIGPNDLPRFVHPEDLEKVQRHPRYLAGLRIEGRDVAEDPQGVLPL